VRIALWTRLRKRYTRPRSVRHQPLYYVVLRSGLVFRIGNQGHPCLGRVRREINWHALHEFMYYGNPLGTHTLFDGL